MEVRIEYVVQWSRANSNVWWDKATCSSLDIASESRERIDSDWGKMKSRWTDKDRDRIVRRYIHEEVIE